MSHRNRKHASAPGKDRAGRAPDGANAPRQEPQDARSGRKASAGDDRQPSQVEGKPQIGPEDDEYWESPTPHNM